MRLLIPLLFLCSLVSLPTAAGEAAQVSTMGKATPRPAVTAIAIFGGGCFWFMESAFRTVDGVVEAQVGFAGGKIDVPTYQQVCSGDTGHAEVVRVVYDPAKVGYDRLLRLFFQMHDPTTLNRQGADRGTQYRSLILTTDATQLETATAMKATLIKSGKRVVTEIAALPPGAGRFHPAGEDHQDYFNRHPREPYCVSVIRPKMEHFRAVLANEGGAKP